VWLFFVCTFIILKLCLIYKKLLIRYVHIINLCYFFVIIRSGDLRYFAVVVLVCLFIFSIVGIGDSMSLISYLNSDCENIEIVDCDEFCQVIKIDKENSSVLLSNLCVEEINKFYIEDRLIVEGYTNKLKKYVVVDGMKMNIQVSISDNVCLVGYPLIKNSF